MRRLFDVRDGEGRVALLGFAALLLVIITGHTVLEAARDALLLVGPGARALGAVYIVIAVFTWPAAALAARASARFGARRCLGGTLAVAASLPVGLFLVPASTTWAMAVYVASGLIASIVVPQFWTLAGKVLTVAQGRRLFGLIAAAGVLGGVLGSGVATAVLLVLPVRALLLVASAVFVVAGAALLRVGGEERADRRGPARPLTVAESARALREQPLLGRIALSVVVSTAALLVLDYCFKSTLARSLPSAQIGPFVARYYLALNVLSLVVQVFLGSTVVRRVGIMAAIVLTPLLLTLGAAGVVVGGGALSAVLVMKAVDGALRFSIHRITGELIYLPVGVRLRQHFKPLIDGALARASQTVTGAALLLLGGTWILAPRPLAVIVTMLAGAWLVVAVSMRRPYLALLRQAVSSGSLHAQEDPGPLDLESAQLLVQRLASEDPLEVVGAMNALSRRKHDGFVPALVLLHSDELVLTQALESFGASTRTDWMPLARRLLSDDRESVRMAAARALAMHDALDLERLAHDVGPRVRGYAAIDLALRAGLADVLEHDGVEALVHEPGDAGASARLGMLAAIADAPATPALSRVLLALSGPADQSPEHTGFLARAAAHQGDPRLVPQLVDLLSARESREAVRTALVAFGQDGLQAAWWALRDTKRPRRFRIHVPKTIGRFGTRIAAEYLLENIETEEDGLVRQKSVHALELLVAARRIPLDRTRVERLAYDALVRHFRFLGERVALGASTLVAGRASAAEQLLTGLLDDKLRQSLGRVFRLLAIARPREDFRRVRIACLSDDPYMRANAGELLDALLRHRDEQPLRELLRLITEDLPAPERASRAAALVDHPVPRGREEALSAMMRERERDPILAELAAACSKGPSRADELGRRRWGPMRDVQHERIQRELFLATFGENVGATESWVTDRLTSLLEEQVARAGETLFVAGDPPEFYYFLREGRVKLERDGSKPWTYDGPTVFGMSDALLDRPRVRTAFALTDIQAMKIPSEAWLELLEDSFSLARSALVGSIHIVAELEQRLWAAGALSPRPGISPGLSGAELDVIERLAALNRAPLLHVAGVQTLSVLAAASEVTVFEPGDVLFERGKPGGRALLVLEGEVEAVREAPHVLWRGAAGDIVCGAAAFGDSVLAWEARARTRGRALAFRVADWLDLMEENFDMVRMTLGALSLDREELLERLQ